jgi:hypothetical protein
MAEACLDDYSGCAVNAMESYYKTLYGPLVDKVVNNFCDEKEKIDFELNDWKAYYGPKIWDTKTAASVVALFIPVSTAAAVEEIMGEYKDYSSSCQACASWS